MEETVAATKGKSVQVRVTALMKGKWLEYPSFQWQVAAEAIDGYLSYRLIEPGYEVWNNLQLCERSLEDFSEKVIADNKLTGGNCMNCHTYGKQSGRLSMFHLRGKTEEPSSTAMESYVSSASKMIP